MLSSNEYVEWLAFSLDIQLVLIFLKIFAFEIGSVHIAPLAGLVD